MWSCGYQVFAPILCREWRLNLYFQNIDLNALTSWIPERISMSKSEADERFDKDKEFKRILDRFHKGHCLVTIATGDISDAEADRAGLVPTHAYAMLDIREVSVSQCLHVKVQLETRMYSLCKKSCYVGPVV